MTNWSKLLRRAVRDEAELVLRRGASGNAIAQMSASLKFESPPEFVELYSAFDGIGILLGSEDPEEGQELLWWFPPLIELPEFMANGRSWFADDHPELAQRFFPFINFHNGECAGYLKNNQGKIKREIFIFESGSFEFDSDQDPNEFLIPIANSIKSYLKS